MRKVVEELIAAGVITLEDLDKTKVKIAAIDEAFSNESSVKRILLYGGSRSSKTFRIVQKIVARALLYPGSRHLIFRDTYNAVRMAIGSDTLPKV